RPAFGGAWRVRAQPVGQDPFGARDHGGDRPDGVVEVEGDGANRKIHHLIVSRARRAPTWVPGYSSSFAQPSRPSTLDRTILQHTSSGTASSRPMIPHSQPNTISARISTSGDSAIRAPSTIGVMIWPSMVCRPRSI